MRKYLTVFAIDWQNQFIYRLNFVLWRLRNILRFLMTYFLWRGIFTSNQSVFGYSQPQMLTYVFLVLAIQTLVLSAPSSDNVGGEIASGDLSNYLVKPISYLKFWFTRDLSSKLLNLVFAAGEIFLLWLILHPTIHLPNNLLSIVGFLIVSTIAVVTYYFVNLSARFVAFWTPELTWGASFIVLVLLEILSGGIFPLDILPEWINTALRFTPFPYLVYFPIAIFVGKITGVQILSVTLQSLAWATLMFLFTKYLWRKGLATYSSEGR